MKRLLAAACTSVLLAQAAALSAAPFVGIPAERVAAEAAVAGPPRAVSADGRWRATADGDTLVIDDLRDGRRAQTLAARALDGRGRGGVAEIHAVAVRRSFVVVFDSLDELWEVSTDPQAEPIYDGLVHDYKMGEGIARPGFLNPRRTKLDAPLRALRFDRSGGFVIARAPDRQADGRRWAVLQVWQLDVRRRIGERLVDGEPDLAVARPVTLDGAEALEIPLHGGGTVTIAWRRP